MPGKQTVPEHQINAVQQLLLDGQFRRALESARILQEQFPDALGPLTLATRASLDLGETSLARDFACRATQLRPRNIAARLLYAQSLVMLGDSRQAFALVAQIEESAAQQAGALRRIARFHERFGRTSDAYRLMLKAREAQPDNADGLYRTALLARRLDRAREAQALCRRLISLEPDHAEACFLRATLQPARPGDHHLEALDFLLKAHPDEDARRGSLCRALGRELEDLGQYEAAFVSYEEAARLLKTGDDESYLLDSSSVQAVEEAFEPIRTVACVPGLLKEQRTGAAGDLFLIGLPCTGFDAFGRWLGAQEPFEPLGRADPAFWLNHQRDKAAAQSLRCVEAQDVRQFAQSLNQSRLFSGASQARWLLHDAPGQFQHLGLLRRALPHARFIHFRRDPLDQCLDLFCPEPGERQLGSISLDKLLDHFTAYHRLMGFWRRHFSGGMLEIDYAQFVETPGQVWDTIRDFLELEPSGPALSPQTVTERPGERLGRAQCFPAALSTLARRLRANGVPVS